MMFIATTLAYLAMINLATYVTFAVDKRAATLRQRRMRETHLLALAALGGWGGAKYAQQKLRHKTVKQPFAARLNLIGMLHCLCIGAFAIALASQSVVAISGQLKGAVQDPAVAADIQRGRGSPSVSRRPPAARPATP